MKLILYSADDMAGKNIASLLRESHGFADSGKRAGLACWERDDMLLAEVDPSVLMLGSLDIGADIALVASRHRAESGMPALTCHPTGNFASADIGGEPGTLQKTSSHYLRSAYMNLKRIAVERDLPYEVTREVTHHGPTGLPFPLVYVEVGSSPKQWGDMAAIAAATDAILAMLSEPPKDTRSLIGFGGPHYAPNFNELAKEYAVGHIMPKYNADNASADMVAQMIELTDPVPDLAAIDWKGLTGRKRRAIIEAIESVGLEWKKTSELK